MSLPSSKLVCIVDDNSCMRAATCSLVRSFGWDMQTFARAAEFLASPDAPRAGCDVSDIRMPGLDGLELLARLRQKDRPPQVIALSAYATDRLRERAVADRALCVIDKPGDADGLAAWIRRSLAFG